ncbi:MAG: CBS domain-containing protein [Promethearchaeota archaeon]
MAEEEEEEKEQEEFELPTVADLDIYDEFEAVTDTMNVLEAAKLMKSKDIGDLVVITEDEVLSGVVMESDIIRKVVAESKDPNTISVKDIMRNVEPLPSDTDVITATKYLVDHELPLIPIVQKSDRKLVGVLTINDCMLVLKEMEAYAEMAEEEEE